MGFSNGEFQLAQFIQSGLDMLFTQRPIEHGDNLTLSRSGRNCHLHRTVTLGKREHQPLSAIFGTEQIEMLGTEAGTQFLSRCDESGFELVRQRPSWLGDFLFQHF